MESRHKEALALVLDAAANYQYILEDEEVFTGAVDDDVTILSAAISVVQKDLLDE